MAQVAEALLDSDEIWVDWSRRDEGNKPVLVRKYIRVGESKDGFAVFSWSEEGWLGTTAFAPDDDPDHSAKQRTGELLWKCGK